MTTTIILTLALLGVAGLLIDAHRSEWRNAKNRDDLSVRQQRFARARFRRRMFASSLIAVVGGLIAMKPIIPHEPWWLIIYVALLIGATMWMLLLGALDAFASHNYYRQRRLEQQALAMQLQRELEEARRRAGETANRTA